MDPYSLAGHEPGSSTCKPSRTSWPTVITWTGPLREEGEGPAWTTKANGSSEGADADVLAWCLDACVVFRKVPLTFLVIKETLIPPSASRKPPCMGARERRLGWDTCSKHDVAAHFNCDRFILEEHSNFNQRGITFNNSLPRSLDATVCKNQSSLTSNEGRPF